VSFIQTQVNATYGSRCESDIQRIDSSVCAGLSEDRWTTETHQPPQPITAIRVLVMGPLSNHYTTLHYPSGRTDLQTKTNQSIAAIALMAIFTSAGLTE